MKNVYGATRPAWSQMGKSEMRLILIASILVGLIGFLGELFVHDLVLDRYYPDEVKDRVARDVVHGIWGILETTMVTLGCLLIIKYYKKLSVGCYPTTFIYCFVLPAESTPSGKSQVLGYCHVEPNEETGEIDIGGASFSWENGELIKRVGFTSAEVRGSKEKDETTCHIRFTINADDVGKRNYNRGLLQFRLDKTTDLSAGKNHDIYAGYLQTSHQRGEIHGVEVRAKGYAEWYTGASIREDDVQTVLKRRGDELFAILQAMLRAKPMPTLWVGTTDMQFRQTNFWGHQIPTPQEVILNDELRPYIYRLLSKMLSLAGLEQAAVEQFKALAADKAIIDRDYSRVEYEFDLKTGLTRSVNERKLNATLFGRARIIKAQIEPFLAGDSLLDIGCGNGMIACLVRDSFKQVKLLDVVEYLPPTLRLPFALYKEGEQLPIDTQFDTVLLLTVLHHSANPLELLKLAWAATKRRLIIIESVVGVHKLERDLKYELVNESDENQIGYAAFVDWFYNRVLHNDVPVPYNFTTPERWKSVFMEEGMKLSHTVHLGQDIEIGPEYHVLFVLDKDSTSAVVPHTVPQSTT